MRNLNSRKKKKILQNNNEIHEQEPHNIQNVELDQTNYNEKRTRKALTQLYYSEINHYFEENPTEKKIIHIF